MTYGWKSQLAVGAVGEARVLDWLEAHGFTVEDCTKSRDHQRRDVDFLISAKGVTKTAEVKTDTHAPRCIFVELRVDHKPGYLFKTRAEVLLYAFPERDLLYWIDVPRLLHWVYEHGPDYDLKVITSHRGSRTWTAEGIVVPLAALLDEGMAHEHSLIA